MITALDVKELIHREFGDCLKSMQDIGWDSSNKVSMVEIRERFYCYDDIVRRFYREIGPRQPGGDEDEEKDDSLRSPDMILFKDDTLWFVEFKNGKINERVKDNIKVKAVEGGLIVMYRIASTYKDNLNFPDILDLKKSFVLVYNDDKNPLPREAAKPVNRYKSHIRAIPVRFGLDVYKDTFFNQVRTFSPKNFEQWLETEGFIPGKNKQENDPPGEGVQ